MIDWVNVAGAAFGGIALGVEAKRFLDESRHWRHGRCDLVSAKHETLVETIESSGKKTVRETRYRRLRLMNVGIAPIRLIGILYRGVTPLKGSPELFGGRELLSPGDEYSLGAIDIEDDAWMLVTYRDGSDRRFVFLQFIDLSSDPDDPLDDLGLMGCGGAQDQGQCTQKPRMTFGWIALIRHCGEYEQEDRNRNENYDACLTRPYI